MLNLQELSKWPCVHSHELQKQPVRIRSMHLVISHLVLFASIQLMRLFADSDETALQSEAESTESDDDSSSGESSSGSEDQVLRLLLTKRKQLNILSGKVKF